MTQDEIIEMARQAGFEDFVRWSERYPHEVQRWVERMEAFAKLIAAKAFQNGYEKGVAVFNEAVWIEREAIKKLCEELSNNTEPHKDYEDYDDGWVDACNACKWAVTKRGEA